jgi:hypothetical protein
MPVPRPRVWVGANAIGGLLGPEVAKADILAKWGRPER